ncbi:DNA cytosine methyltransferase [Undibacterium sp. SXout11W]|uniref:DNA cytosine methyltransferase n=1 Tax=Undibacterium sp. SXout11W TaxID=3413050 RepID=UPI003BF1B79C
MKIASFFAGAGGLDLGFKKAGFEVIWANEYDKEIWETYEKNHPETILCRKSITEVTSSEVPEVDGIIGGPPCQSWSEAGALRGIGDKRGQLFFDFIRILDEKKPKFFLAENVSGMLLPRHAKALDAIKQLFKECGYTLSFTLLNAKDFDVPQDRKRVFFVGFRNDLNVAFKFPEPSDYSPSLKDAISDLEKYAKPALNKTYTNGSTGEFSNHEYMTGGFSTMYMSRNRVRGWDEQSFTIQAGGRHAPIHPSAPPMEFISQNVRIFAAGHEEKYRRLSIRECARIQTFPDDFVYHYKNLTSGYKMIGNAVPVNLAKAIAAQIKTAIENGTTDTSHALQESLGGTIQERMLNILQLHKSDQDQFPLYSKVESVEEEDA